MMKKLASVVVLSWTMSAVAGCSGGEEKAPPVEAKPQPPKPPAPAPAPAPVAAAAKGDGGAGDASSDAKKSKLGPMPTDGLSLADRIAKRKADEAKLAGELATQEKDRLLKYDKTKMAQHQALFAFITKTRKAQDDLFEKGKGKPDTKDKLAKLRDGQFKAIEAQGKVVRAIDPKGGNSNIVTDEDVALNLLANEYVAALLGALDGDEAGLKAQREELDKRIKKIGDWIDELKKAKK